MVSVMTAFIPKKCDILIVEPLSIDFVHVTFNADLLHTISVNYPDRTIAFCAEKQHLKRVQKILDNRCSGDFLFNGMSATLKDKRGFFLYLNSLLLVLRVFVKKSTISDKVLVFTSINVPLLLITKLLAKLIAKELKIYVVHHSELAQFGLPTPVKLRSRLLKLENIMGRWKSPSFTHIFLGQSIANNVYKKIPSIRDYSMILDHPICQDRSYKTDEKSVFGRTFRFGFLGAPLDNKGFKVFYNLAKHVKSKKITAEKSEFFCPSLVGLSSDYDDVKKYISLPDKNIPNTEQYYIDQCNGMTYSIFCASKGNYKYHASGSVFDSLKAFCPVICLGTDYCRSLFEKFGDIGYLCESEEELVATVEALLINPQNQRYLQQVTNIRCGLDYFSPNSLRIKF